MPDISIIIPIRNEAGTVSDAVTRTLATGLDLEIILVEGGSLDGTWDAAVREAQRPHSGVVRAFRQPGRGKADAVRFGLGQAQGSVAAILDGDLGVAPEDLPRFLEPLAAGPALVNGVRPKELRQAGAMRWANSIGNAAFARAMSLALRQRVHDSLCGTKAFRLADWRRWSSMTAHWQRLDPFGDFEILTGAVLLGLPIIEIPVQYHARTYGQTNISRWSDGLRLLRVTTRVAYEVRRTNPGGHRGTPR